ncbi:hypothetical protein KOR42_16760 [Thalassoglobus neptunius]|uniref:Uncharacterized protein n=1 Tax=Thalassoglobus neptunius TaxID=1938619 RepID=A0A5C5X8V1_9PLAN|nr:hypothetical protein [Thalassoglobus neptunius]TWT58302.1 hypothetical protein KOR42_16760 [Thalassoglobus neptunius]
MNNSNRFLSVMSEVPVLVFAGIPIAGSLWPLDSTMVVVLSLLSGFLLVGLILTGIPIRRRLIVFSALMIASVAFLNWPLKLAFAASQNDFERVAKQLDDGETVQAPIQIGLFNVAKAEVNRNGVICFWTDDDPSGATGFVNGDESVGEEFNLWSQCGVARDWQFLSED